MKNNNKKPNEHFKKSDIPDSENSKSRIIDIIAMIREKKYDIDTMRERFNDLSEASQLEISEILNRDIEWSEYGFESRQEQVEHWISKFEIKESRQENNNPPFHVFEEIEVAVNAMGLYRSIIGELEFEKDPKKLKDLFSERLGQVLESIPDSMASAISNRIHGFEE